jgi:hypothetical protein
LYRRSTHERGNGRTSFGNRATPVGTSTRSAVFDWPCMCSQYRRADEVIVPVTQYVITLVSIWSRVNAFSGCPSQSLHVRNFSTIHASSPAGESLSAAPSVWGFVPCSFA